MAVMEDVSAKDYVPIVCSKNHCIVKELYPQAVPASTPEVTEKEYESMGYDGIVGKTITLKKFPFSLSIVSPNPSGNPYKLIAGDKNPYAKSLGLNETIGFSKGKELEFLFLRKSGLEIVDGVIFGGTLISSVGNPVNLDGGGEISMNGDAMLFLELLKAPNIEGIGSLVKVTAHPTTPDTKAYIDYESDENRALYLILDTSSFVPRKAFLPIIDDADIPAFEGVDSTEHAGTSGDEVIDLLVAYETGSGYGDIALTVVQGTPVTPPTTPTAPSLSDVATHVAGLPDCNSTTRFCVLAEVFIDEDDGSVIIDTADITKKQHSTLTYQRTPIALTKRTKESLSSLLFDDYCFLIKVDGERETDDKKVNSSSDTTLTLSGSYDMIEAITAVDAYSFNEMPLV